MSESRDISLRVFRFYAYVLVSFLLAIPLLLWPLSLVVQLESSFAVTIANNWAVSVAVMLLAVTVIDSFFSGAKSSGQLLAHVAWVVVTTAVLSKIIYASNSAYLLGLMFFTHSFRSSSLLWQGEINGWLWPAWIRDSSMAMLLLFWATLFPS